MKFAEAAAELGVGEDAPIEDVKRAYRKLALQVGCVQMACSCASP
jgi:hypothetical protein